MTSPSDSDRTDTIASLRDEMCQHCQHAKERHGPAFPASGCHVYNCPCDATFEG